MPRYKYHVLGSAAAYGLLLIMLMSYSHSLFQILHWGMWCFLGGLFPDIDTKSRGQRYVYSLCFLALLFFLLQQYYAAFIALSFLMIIPIMSRHRGLFHRTWFLVLMPLTIWAIFAAFFPAWSRPFFLNTLFFIAGALSHLFLDFIVAPQIKSSRFLRRLFR